jgi:hypothetical protein
MNEHKKGINGMAIEELSSSAIEQRVGTRHPTTGMIYPPDGLQPYYQWLIRTLHLLAESSAGAFRVAQDDANATTVRVMPGRASINGVALAYSGDAHDLSSFNNATAYLALTENNGQAQVNVSAQADGWPSGAHIKLAEVTINAGEITQVLDRRFETLFKV